MLVHKFIVKVTEGFDHGRNQIACKVSRILLRPCPFGVLPLGAGVAQNFRRRHHPVQGHPHMDMGIREIGILGGVHLGP
ncbi:hypothetical protein D3C87_1784110 [compost metagenome]